MVKGAKFALIFLDCVPNPRNRSQFANNLHESPGNSTAEWLGGSIAMKHGGKKGREGRKKKEQVVNFTRERDGTANYSINSD